jgi:hypothetical protein
MRSKRPCVLSNEPFDIQLSNMPQKDIFRNILGATQLAICDTESTVAMVVGKEKTCNFRVRVRVLFW